MADATSIVAQTATETDIFESLKKTNEALVDVLTRNQQSQPVYVSSPAPVSASPTTNYAMLIGIGLLVLFLFKGKIL